MSKVAIGKAKFGSEKRKYFKLKDGESTFRILPPLGDLAESGRWSSYYNIHYGYKNTEGKMRPFQSPLVKDRKTKMVSAPDAALERLEKLKAQFDQAKKIGHKEAIEKLDKLVGRKGQFNLDSHHYLNVVDEQGNIGVLKIRHRCKVALDTELKRLRESEGIDALSVEDGRFLIFGRSGMGLDTSFTVRVKKEKIKVDGVGTVERDIVHVLGDEILNRLGTEAAQLDKIFKRPTSEEVARIVKDGAVAVDAILNNKAADTAATEEDFSEYETETVEAPAEAAPAPATAAPVTPPPAAKVETPVAAPVAAPAKTESLSTAPKTTAQNLSDMSLDDFLKTLDL